MLVAGSNCKGGLEFMVGGGVQVNKHMSIV